jgi:excisionase family DNA binding protein
MKTQKNNNGIITIGEEKYLTSKAAAEYLKISSATLHYLKAQKKITFLRHGGLILYKKEWLDEYLAESTSDRRQK